MSQTMKQNMQEQQQRMYIRYRSFAERLGPSNAKSILLHYLGVLTLSATVFKLRFMVIDYCNKCE